MISSHDYLMETRMRYIGNVDNDDYYGGRTPHTQKKTTNVELTSYLFLM